MKPLEYTYLKSAVVSQDQNHIFSEDYQDVYFNTEDGLEETQYVFLAGNNLTTQWTEHQQRFFCIAETGFGSGVNFLTTCLAWHNCLFKKTRHLHFISTELHPLSVDNMRLAHEQFPQLKKYSQLLLAQYGSMRAGFHRLKITDDITLTLLLGDAVQSLKQLEAKVDAWYLDGFAPSRNPQMWSPALFEQLARLSKKGTTFATFSAAALVKKGLTEVGFSIQKKKGFGPKREMLVGYYASEPKTHALKQPWHPLPSQINQTPTVTILGGGIAGMCLARSFHQAGYQTTIIDRHSQAFQEGSGNGYAMVMPLITARKSHEALFYLRAFEHAQKTYESEVYRQIGINEWVQSDRLQAVTDLSLSKEMLLVENSQIKYPQAGFVDTQHLTHAWLQHISQWLQADICNITRENQKWQLFNQTGQLVHQCDCLIVTAGMFSKALIDFQELPLTAKLGQTNQLKTAKALPFNEIQLKEGYIIPIESASQHYLIGATFDHFDMTDWNSDLGKNFNHLRRNLEHWQSKPFFSTLSQAEIRSSHTAVRATTPDHLPICGPVINQSEFMKEYSDLHHGRHWQHYPEAPVIPDLYVMTGLGSRGFTSAPLLADYLMSMITGQPLPIEVDLCKIIHPNRFNYRQLKKAP